jgi:F-box and WD-40 domain protein 1/11
LEENWLNGRFAQFQLPHPDHQDEGHENCIYTLQYSGNYVVTGSRDKTIRIWNLQTQRLIRAPLYGHAASVICLRFDARKEENVIVSGGSDANLIVWKFSTGEIVQKVTDAHIGSILHLQLDEKYLVTSGVDSLIKVWCRRRTPEQLLAPLSFSLSKVLRGHTAAVICIRLLGDEVVSASGDYTIKVWNAETGDCLMSILAHDKGISCIDYDGQRIISGGNDNSVRIFDRTTGAELVRLDGHSDLVRAVKADFTPIPESQDSIGDPGGFIRTAPSLAADTFSVEPGGGLSGNHKIFRRIVTGSYDGSLVIWSPDSHGTSWVHSQRLFLDSFSNILDSRLSQGLGTHRRFRAFCLHIDARRIICASQDTKVLVWDFERSDG